MKLLLLLPVLLMLMAGCGENPKGATIEGHKTLTVDTIVIHGHPHEIILRTATNGKGATTLGMGWGGIMHSPECWCGKEVAR